MSKIVNKELTEKQKRFVDEYLKDLNAKQAAIRAGYSEATAEVQASRMLSKVKVQEYLHKRQEKLQKKTEVTQEWIINNLKRIVEICMHEETFEHAGANKALELLGKTLGMYTDKVEHKGGIKITHEDALKELE